MFTVAGSVKEQFVQSCARITYIALVGRRTTHSARWDRVFLLQLSCIQLFFAIEKPLDFDRDRPHFATLGQLFFVVK